jgi:hypothetical protein
MLLLNYLSRKLLTLLMSRIYSIHPPSSFDHCPSIPTKLLVRLTKHLLGISCNSASCKQLFSSFGTTLTKHHNCLGQSFLESITELRAYIQNQHILNRQHQKIRQSLGSQGSSISSMLSDSNPMLQSIPDVINEGIYIVCSIDLLISNLFYN